MSVEPRSCSDCGSSHIGLVPCGMTFLQRLRSTQIHGSVTPTRDKKDYWDEEPLKALLGGKDKHTRREEMAEATDGRGYTTLADLE